MRAAGERLDVQRLRVVPVDPVADAAQPREVAQVLRLDGSAGHPSILSVRPTVIIPGGGCIPSRNGGGYPCELRQQAQMIAVGLPPETSRASRMESVRRAPRRCAVIISLGGAPCRDHSRGRARTNRPPESFINGLVFTLKGLTLAR